MKVNKTKRKEKKSEGTTRAFKNRDMQIVFTVRIEIVEHMVENELDLQIDELEKPFSRREGGNGDGM